jgi:hypothetical protein
VSTPFSSSSGDEEGLNAARGVAAPRGALDDDPLEDVLTLADTAVEDLFQSGEMDSYLLTGFQQYLATSASPALHTAVFNEMMKLHDLDVMGLPDDQPVRLLLPVTPFGQATKIFWCAVTKADLTAVCTTRFVNGLVDIGLEQAERVRAMRAEALRQAEHDAETRRFIEREEQEERREADAQARALQLEEVTLSF